MSNKEYGITSKALDYLDKVVGLDFLEELREKYPDRPDDEEQNDAYWDEVAKKFGYKDNAEWIQAMLDEPDDDEDNED